MIRSRDLAFEDFPFTIVVHREAWAWEDKENWLWAVTILPPTPGHRAPLYVPAAGEPAWVSTLSAQGVEVTTGPYD